MRIGHYEDGVSGRHDASKVLTPFLQSFLSQRRRQRIAVWLYDAASLNKLSQSVLEMLRGGIQDLAVDVTVFYTADADLDDVFMQPLPIALRNLRSASDPPGKAFVQALVEQEFDYAAIFESSGMYRGEDLVSVIPPLMSGRLDAVWGSRRLSLKDIEASYRLRYNHKALLGSFSYVGSHVLSAAYLLLFGRYVSDTLSGVRAVRAGFLTSLPVAPDDKLANQYLLCALLREKADLLETPVQFLALSPERVRRTTLAEGLRSLAVIAWQRITRPKRAVAGRTCVGDLTPAERRGAGRGAPATKNVRTPDTSPDHSGRRRRQPSSKPYTEGSVAGERQSDDRPSVRSLQPDGAAIRACRASVVRSRCQTARRTARACSRRSVRDTTGADRHARRDHAGVGRGTAETGRATVDYVVRSNRRASTHDCHTRPDVARTRQTRQPFCRHRGRRHHTFTSIATPRAESRPSVTGARGTRCLRSAKATWVCSRCRLTRTSTCFPSSAARPRRRHRHAREIFCRSCRGSFSADTLF